MKRRLPDAALPPNKKKFPFRTCLSDGVTQSAIENFFRDSHTLKETQKKLAENQMTVFRTSDINDYILSLISPQFPHATQLFRLILVQGNLSIQSIQPLCKALGQSPHILHLDLRSNQLSEDCIASIIAVLPETKISTLNLGQNHVNLQAFESLSGLCPSLMNITLDGNSFDNASAVFSKVLSSAQNLTHFSLVDCNLKGDDIDSLVLPLRKHPNLTSLHLCCNPIRAEGIQALTRLIVNALALQELSIVGISYTEDEGQTIVDALANRSLSTLKVLPNTLSRRAFYLRRLYPGKDQILRFLEEHELEKYKELFFRFEITVQSLQTNEYLLQSLEKYQLNCADTSVIQQAIHLARSSNVKTRRNTVQLVSDKLFQHLLISDVEIVNAKEIDGESCDSLFQRAVWYSENPVFVRELCCRNINHLYALQAAANRLFRLRHPYVLDFLGIYVLPSSCLSARESVLQFVFEDTKHLSLLNWMYSQEGKQAMLTDSDFQSTLLEIALKVAQVLDYINSHQKMVYNELKLSRIALDLSPKGEIIPKLLDFGLPENSMEANNQDNKISIRYRPPEGSGRRGIDEWMYGVFLWELYSHAARSTERETSSFPIFPFADLEENEIISALFAGAKLSQPTGCPNAVYQLICDSTIPTPSKRLSFNHMYNQLTLIMKKMPIRKNSSLQLIQQYCKEVEAVSYSDNSDFMMD